LSIPELYVCPMAGRQSVAGGRGQTPGRISTNTWALEPSQPNFRNASAARLRRICQTGRRITSPLKHFGSGGCIVRDSTRPDLNATKRLPRQPAAPTGVGPDDIFAPATHFVPLVSPAGLRPQSAFRPPTRPPAPGGDLGPRSPYRATPP